MTVTDYVTNNLPSVSQFLFCAQLHNDLPKILINRYNV